MANRLKAMGVKGYENGFAVTLHPEKLREPLERKKPTMYFVSMGDLFHEDVPFSFIKEVFLMMGYANQHTYQILTKRPERMREFILWFMDKIPAIEGEKRRFEKKRRFENWSNNIWLGATAENQEQADKRISILLDTPAALRFVSIEPMLSHIDLTKYLVRYRCYSCGQESLESPDKCPSCGHSELGDKYFSSAVDWVIVGGETGAGARPLQYEWVKDIQEQCKAANVPFFFKKWGKTAYQYGKVMNIAPASVLDGVIDGVECRQMPEATK